MLNEKLLTLKDRRILALALLAFLLLTVPLTVWALLNVPKLLGYASFYPASPGKGFFPPTPTPTPTPVPQPFTLGQPTSLSNLEGAITQAPNIWDMVEFQGKLYAVGSVDLAKTNYGEIFVYDPQANLWSVAKNLDNEQGVFHIKVLNNMLIVPGLDAIKDLNGNDFPANGPRPGHIYYCQNNCEQSKNWQVAQVNLADDQSFDQTEPGDHVRDIAYFQGKWLVSESATNRGFIWQADKDITDPDTRWRKIFTGGQDEYLSRMIEYQDKLYLAGLDRLIVYDGQNFSSLLDAQLDLTADVKRYKESNDSEQCRSTSGYPSVCDDWENPYGRCGPETDCNVVGGHPKAFGIYQNRLYFSDSRRIFAFDGKNLQTVAQPGVYCYNFTTYNNHFLAACGDTYINAYVNKQRWMTTYYFTYHDNDIMGDGQVDGQVWATQNGTSWTKIIDIPVDRVSSLASFKNKLFLGTSNEGLVYQALGVPTITPSHPIDLVDLNLSDDERIGQELVVTGRIVNAIAPFTTKVFITPESIFSQGGGWAKIEEKTHEDPVLSFKLSPEDFVPKKHWLFLVSCDQSDVCTGKLIRVSFETQDPQNTWRAETVAEYDQSQNQGIRALLTAGLSYDETGQPWMVYHQHDLSTRKANLILAKRETDGSWQKKVFYSRPPALIRTIKLELRKDSPLIIFEQAGADDHYISIVYQKNSQVIEKQLPDKPGLGWVWHYYDQENDLLYLTYLNKEEKKLKLATLDLQTEIFDIEAVRSSFDPLYGAEFGLVKAPGTEKPMIVYAGEWQAQPDVNTREVHILRYESGQWQDEKLNTTPLPLSAGTPNALNLTVYLELEETRYPDFGYRSNDGYYLFGYRQGQYQSRRAMKELGDNPTFTRWAADSAKNVDSPAWGFGYSFFWLTHQRKSAHVFYGYLAEALYGCRSRENQVRTFYNHQGRLVREIPFLENQGCTQANIFNGKLDIAVSPQGKIGIALIEALAANPYSLNTALKFIESDQPVIISPSPTPISPPPGCNQPCGWMARAGCPTGLVCTNSWYGNCRAPNCSQDTNCLCYSLPAPSPTSQPTLTPTPSKPPDLCPEGSFCTTSFYCSQIGGRIVGGCQDKTALGRFKVCCQGK